jgi:hypothetical protein
VGQGLTVVRRLFVGTLAIAVAGLVGGLPAPGGADVVVDYQGPWAVTLLSDDEDVFDDADVYAGPESHELFIDDKGTELYLELTDRSDPLHAIEILILGHGSLREGFDRSQLSFRVPEAFYQDLNGVVNVSDDGSTCPVDQAHLDIRELHRTDGVVDRLWMLFEQRCRGSARALFGEIRLGIAAPPVDTTPSVVRWPATTVVGGVNKVVPVRVSTPSGAIGDVAASILGRDADSFTVVDTTCQGPGTQLCTVSVAFQATGPGLARARLRITTGRGSTTVPLTGFGLRGVSRLTMHSEGGDYLGDGQDYRLDASEHAVIAFGSRTRVQAWAEWGDWLIYLEPPDGEKLRVGTYLGTAASSVGHAGAVLRIHGEGRGCGYSHGRFEIRRATYVAPGRLSALDLEFAYWCESSGSALRGRFRWNSRADLDPPPPVTNVSATRRGDRWLLTWKNPNVGDFAGTEVRWYHGATWPARLPDVGWPAARPSGRSAVIDPRRAGPVIVSVSTIDKRGNAGPPRVVVLR